MNELKKKKKKKNGGGGGGGGLVLNGFMFVSEDQSTFWAQLAENETAHPILGDSPKLVC